MKNPVSHVLDLDVVLSNDLNILDHINIIYSKAIRNLGFLKRKCSEFNDPTYLIILY